MNSSTYLPSESIELFLFPSMCITTLFTLLSFFTSAFVFFLVRFKLNKHLLLLNSKLNMLEGRLSTRELPEPLIKHLCARIGVSFEIVVNDRLKMTESLVNDERRLKAEFVTPERELQYDTLANINENIFPQRGLGELIDKTKTVTQTEKREDGTYHYENLEVKKASEDVPRESLESKRERKSSKENEKKEVKKKEDPPKIKIPTKSGIVPVNDPNYLTLAGIDNQIFGDDKDKKPQVDLSKPQVPLKSGMAAVNDPNYLTLAGLDNKIFIEVEEKDKKKKKRELDQIEIGP